jgi:UDP-GlcNAc:undecaprenyl-phosphate GlcNAc-1-phosphate transferase
MIALYVFLGSLVSGVLMLALVWRLLSSERLSRINYRGVKLPTAAGVVLAPAFLLVWLVTVDYAARHLADDARFTNNNFHSLNAGMNAMLIIVLGFCLLGLLDDVAGDSSARGFKGHLSEALHGRFTTGLVKAFLGFVVALVALHALLVTGGRLTFQIYGEWVMDAAVIALAANFFNLLDLRPGRALKVFFPALGLCAGLTLRLEGVGGAIIPPVYAPLYFYMTPALAVAAIALVLLPGDLREKFMMGDAGSNVLGAVIGLGLVMGTSFWWRLGVLVLLLILNGLAEIFSFSEIIASNRVLHWLDSLGRKGQASAGANNN